jgi:hypothetical protein
VESKVRRTIKHTTMIQISQISLTFTIFVINYKRANFSMILKNHTRNWNYTSKWKGCGMLFTSKVLFGWEKFSVALPLPIEGVYGANKTRHILLHSIITFSQNFTSVDVSVSCECFIGKVSP